MSKQPGGQQEFEFHSFARKRDSNSAHHILSGQVLSSITSSDWKNVGQIICHPYTSAALDMPRGYNTCGKILCTVFAALGMPQQIQVVSNMNLIVARVMC
jgi:hypothetical protein